MASFDDLRKPIASCSEAYLGSLPDLHAYSITLIETYARIPNWPAGRSIPTT